MFDRRSCAKSSNFLGRKTDKRLRLFLLSKKSISDNPVAYIPFPFYERMIRYVLNP